MKRQNTIAIPVVILKTKSGYNAFSPSVEGCVATGKTIDTIIKKFREALEFHFEGQQLLKQKPQKSSKALKDAFSDYGTDAIYASIDIAA
jgi:predicted RNase H-like HicB family nuclease